MLLGGWRWRWLEAGNWYCVIGNSQNALSQHSVICVSSYEMDEIRSDAEVQRVAKNLLLGSAPERESEIESLWSDTDLRFHIVGDVHEGGRIIFDAGCYRDVRFNHRVLRAFWLASFAAWEGYRAIAEAADPSQSDLTRLADLLRHFDEMLSADASDEKPMPFGIPEPGVLVEKEINVEHRAAAELSIIALGWAFLHEIKHIQHQRQGTSAPSDNSDHGASRAEEFSCDAYATDFLLSQVEQYANDNGVTAQSVRFKRELSIYFALFAVTLLAKGKWDQTNSHPAVQDRIDAVVLKMGTGKDELAFAIAHVAFAALNQIWELTPSVVSSKG